MVFNCVYITTTRDPTDKTYSWCLCGKSKSQPLCDGMHKNEFLKIKQR